MSELKRYPMVNITSRWDVEDYQDVYICSDIDPKLDEIAKLKNLLIIRDGGGHDVDCKSNYNRQCNCGHDSVEEYFKEVAK